MFSKLFLLLSFATAFADNAVTVIPLHNRSAESLVPIVRNSYGSEVIVSGAGNKLFVRAAPAIVDEIRQLTSEFDIKPRTLRIGIRGNIKNSSERVIMVKEGVAASLGDGSDTQIVVQTTGQKVNVKILPGANGTSIRSTTVITVGQWVPLGGNLTLKVDPQY